MEAINILKLASIYYKKANLRGGFSWHDFKRLEKLEDMDNYCKERLTHLGSGTARKVYLLSGSKVIKIAKSELGQAQNAGEIQVATNPKTSEIISKIYDFDKNFLWLTAELVKPVGSVVDGALGITYSDFYKQMNGSEETKTNLGTTPFMKALIQLIFDNDLTFKEIWFTEPFGKNALGKLVVYDYGGTNNIWEQFYAKNAK